MTASSSDFADFDFSQSIRDISGGLLVKPILHNYLFDASFPEFDLHFRKQEMERKPDGFYHPSTHPMWSPQALYRYLAYPDAFPVEKKQYMSTLAVMFGKVWHEFIQTCLEDAGVLPKGLQVCEMCSPDVDCHEAGFNDERLGERGHCDGLLDLSVLGPQVPIDLASPVLEIKTRNDNFSNLTKIDDLDLAVFKKKWPVYWAQQQRYMKAFNRTRSIVLMIEPGYPFTMREFHVPIDPGFNQEIDRKYAITRAAVESGEEPYCCRLKGCPSAEMCL